MWSCKKVHKGTITIQQLYFHRYRSTVLEMPLMIQQSHLQSASVLGEEKGFITKSNFCQQSQKISLFYKFNYYLIEQTFGPRIIQLHKCISQPKKA